MAISWGAWEYAGGNGMRVGIEVTNTPVNTNSVNVTFTFKVYTQNQYSYSDSQTLNFGGTAGGGSQGYTNNDGSSAQLRATETHTHVYSTYGNTTTKTFTATVSGAYNGVTPSKGVTITIPARPYAAPNAPSGVALTRNSDTQATLNWTRNVTAQKPYTSQTIQMRTLTGGSWSPYATVTTASSTATSYIKTALLANRAYQMQIRSNNSVGSSGFVASGVIYMTPAAPSNVSAALDGTGTQINVHWSNNHYSDVGNTIEIQRSVGGGAYANVVTGLAYNTTTWTDPAPGGGTNEYRIRVVRTSPTALQSAYVSTNVVSTVVPPLAPTLLDPDGISVDLDNNAIVLDWQHNPGADQAAQTHFSIETSTDGGAIWDPLVTNVASSTSSYTLPAGTLPNSETYAWRVQTQGAITGAFGPWSVSATFTGIDQPTVVLNTPVDGGTTSGLPLTPTWTYAQAETHPQTGWELTLFDTDGITVLETLSGNNAAASASFTYPVVDTHTYDVRLRVRSSDGLWSEYVTHTTTIDLLPPAETTVEPTYDPCTGVVVLALSAAAVEPGVTDNVAYVDIQRRIGDGEWFTLAVNVDITDPTTLVDVIPQTVGDNTYRLIAYASTGSASVSEEATVTAVNDSDEYLWIFLAYGDGFSNVLRMRGNPQTSAVTSRTRATQHFLGRRLPGGLIGAQVDKVISASTELYYRDDIHPGFGMGGFGEGPFGIGEGCPSTEACEYDSPRDDWEQMGWEAEVVCYRDYTGRRLFGVLSSIQTSDILHRGIAGVDFSVTQITYDERTGTLPVAVS